MGFRQFQPRGLDTTKGEWKLITLAWNMKRIVDALVGQERERVVWDDDLKGFSVRVHPTGRRVHIVKTRYRGRPVKVTIGPYGVVTPAIAHGAGVEAAGLAIDIFGHTAFDDRGQCLTAYRAVALAPLQAVGLYRLHRLEGLR